MKENYVKSKMTDYNNFHNYCKLMNKKIGRISRDEVETAKQFEKLIKKYNIKKVKKVSLEKIKDKTCLLYNNEFYDNYYKKKEPIIIKNLKNKIGNCINTFDSNNIIDHIGDTKISIHISTSKYLNNVNKNFHYSLSTLKNFIQLIHKEDQKKKNFSVNYHGNKNHISLMFKDDTGEMCAIPQKINNLIKNYKSKSLATTSITTNIQEDNTNSPLDDSQKINNKCKHKICNNSSGNNTNYYYYYRSLGINQFKEASDIKKMNKFIKDNFFLPPEIYPSYEKFEFFSSVLRIGQPNIFIWLHYDIPDNFLIQIKGRKKILLIHPKYIKYFNILNSSSSYNIFDILLKKKNRNKKEQIIKKIIIKHAYVADLYEGEILHIPSLWMHYVYNMPHHTHLKKKYKYNHRYLYVTPSNKLFYRINKRRKIYNKKKNYIFLFYKNEKFINCSIKRQNKTPSFLRFLNGELKIKTKNMYLKKFKNKKRKNISLQYISNSLFSYNKKYDENNEVLIFPSLDQSFDKNELIKHYSHLENSEELLKQNFNIDNINFVTSNSSKIGNGQNSQATYNTDTKTIEQSNNYSTLSNNNKQIRDFKKTDHHTSKNTNLNISINYFFRKKKELHLFTKKDLYGNQDINTANQIFKKIENEIKPLMSMPSKYKNFYLQKIQGYLYSLLDTKYL
ncbi:conserved Plasmodium protein, unknown function [Plasmodium berghei]|uniref:JmjC domain-containing protein, putative n=2 Tax=Plasmodium berghei TaxID=5821 RepID=A0A509ACN5_PLABA|nr:JmjC domain-containing protein, putative [Plasmodium berghei ANKA]CXH79733.1 conserved Plasmodium protein, unknown function [Plasmodium berghei]SCN21520.1 conserved Plasmodium protein, unknown function [Plasmodium berghei]SCO58765.1 conserved Plasmodium protein, unknown function [Plasmodium berghei]SCO58789.1 conserved Plasmodium protein, unknown function [Plasmodium berghei]VUC53752.1 JmjC domain-containing protein, putative [Plasmodium berghei ANKA]|eukprot:XP_034419616.1 JmjC domain-containing protein, putative [Plasmodium berghei ANKA]